MVDQTQSIGHAIVPGSDKENRRASKIISKGLILDIINHDI